MNKRIKKVGVTLGMVLTVLSVNALPCQAVNYQATENAEMEAETQAVLRTVDIEWKYRYIGGVKYKRLWDKTNEQWLTDWIRCD